MGKVVKAVVSIAAVVVLAVVALPALSGVLYSAFGGALINGAAAGTLAAASAVGSSFAFVAATVASSVIIGAASMLASSLLMGSPKNLNNAAFSRLQTTIEPTTPRKIVFGYTAAGADERFHELTNKSGHAIDEPSDKGDYLNKVVALASHKIHSVEKIYLEDELSYSGGSVLGKYASKSGFYATAITEGSAGNASAFGGGTYWTSAAKFTGCAYLKLRFKLDSDVYPNGVPQRLTTIVKGCPVYDPRLDSSNGGSGSHNPANQSTWQYLNGSNEIGRNSALCLLTYLIGWRINGKLAWGMGIPISRIDLGSFTTYANLCDESVTTKAGGTVKRYQCDVILSTGDQHETNTAIITASMGTAKLVDVDGCYQLIGGYNDLDGPVVTFTKDDFTTQYSWNPEPIALRERYTGARGRFCNPAKLYVLEDWGQIEVDTLADGIPRPLTIELPAVTRSESCQRIAKQILARNSFTGTFTGVFGPRGFLVSVGSLVRLVIPDKGWNQPGKLFRVVDQTESADLIFKMTLQEENETIYAWDSNEAIDLPPDIRPPAYDPHSAEVVSGLAASARTITTSNGGTKSQIDVAWTTPDASVAAIQIEVREAGGSKWQTVADRFNHEAGAFTFSAMAGGIQHEVRARYLMWSGIYGGWSSVTVTSRPDSTSSSVVGYLTNQSVTFAADVNGNIL